MMKHLVTGGAGFIGSHLVDRLIADGNEVIVIDDHSSEANEKFYHNEKARYFDCSVTDFDSIFPLFHEIDVVYHLAAESRIQPCIKNPRLAVETNVVGMCNVLECSRHNGVGRVIYSSTSSAYGLLPLPHKEDGKKDCSLNPYSVTKAAAEDLCVLYHRLYGLETVIFRYFNVYGDRQPTRGQYAPVIGIFMDRRNKKNAMSVVGDGEQRRDYVNVHDVVNANVLASVSENRNILGEIFNVGTGKNYSVNDIVEMICMTDGNAAAVEGKDFEFVENRPGESRITLANIDKIQNMMGWFPQVELKDWIDGKFV